MTKIKPQIINGHHVFQVPTTFNVNAGQLFHVTQLADGIIQYVPENNKFPEIWHDDPDDIAKFNQEIGNCDDSHSMGREQYGG